jgi:uncharacterized LabA/DUF88 family protein
MSKVRRVMFLVDFDNVSTEVIEQALAMVYTEYGAVHVRRAYCTAEHAVAHATFMKRLQLRPMVNLAVGKNSTDIALAVDAMDLAVAERPDVAVIVSSDSDFTPLVGRLREKGAWVRGFGQRGKTGDGVVMAYDQFDDLAHREARARVAPAPAPKPQAKPQPKPQAKPQAQPEEAQAPAAAAARAPAAKKAASKRSPARKQPPAVAPEPAPAPVAAWSAEVESILQAVPDLRRGEKVELGEAAQQLRKAGLLAKTAASTKLFKKHADRFALSPDRQPNKVRFVAELAA